MSKNVTDIHKLASAQLVAPPAAPPPGNSEVSVNVWDVSHSDGALRAIARVDPLKPDQRVIAMSISISSPDQATQFTSALFIPEVDEAPSGVPGSGIWGLTQTHNFDPTKNGSEVLAIVAGFVGTSPDDMKEFQLDKKISL